MSDAEGFGPSGPEAGDAAPFSVNGPAKASLDGSRAGTVSFTVSNATGRAVRARVLVQPGAGTDASWFTIAGDAERALTAGESTKVDVIVKAPRDAATGTFSFVPGAALEEAPDKVVSGPTVAFDVAPLAKPKFPWWIVIVVAAVLLLAGGGVLALLLLRPDTPTPTPSQTATPTLTPTPTSSAEVLREYPFTAIGDISFDLDSARAVDHSTQFEIADLYLGGLTPDQPLLSIVGYGNRALAEVDEPTFEACVAADYPTPGTPIQIEAAETTYLCVDRTDQESRVLLVIDPVEPGSGLQNMTVTVWQRGQG